MDPNLSKGILEAIDTDSYHAEKKATLAIALPDADAEIEPVPTSVTGVHDARNQRSQSAESVSLRLLRIVYRKIFNIFSK
jgi:hypothetical protein